MKTFDNLHIDQGSLNDLIFFMENCEIQQTLLHFTCYSRPPQTTYLIVHNYLLSIIKSYRRGLTVFDASIQHFSVFASRSPCPGQRDKR